MPASSFSSITSVLLSITCSPGNTIFGVGVGAAHVDQEVSIAGALRGSAGGSGRREDQSRLAGRSHQEGPAGPVQNDHAPGRFPPGKDAGAPFEAGSLDRPLR